MHHYACISVVITGISSLSESQNQIKVIPQRLNKQQLSCTHNLLIIAIYCSFLYTCCKHAYKCIILLSEWYMYTIMYGHCYLCDVLFTKLAL